MWTISVSRGDGEFLQARAVQDLRRPALASSGRGLLGLLRALVCLAAWPACVVAGETTGTAITLTVTYPAPAGPPAVLVQGDSNLPDGAAVNVRLAYLGRSLAGARATVSAGQFTATLDPGAPLLPGYYDLVAAYWPEKQGDAEGDGGQAFTRLVAAECFATDGHGEIARAREEDAAFLQERVARARELFDVLREGFAQRTSRPAAFDPAVWSVDYARWSERVSEARAELAAVARKRRIGAYPQVEEEVHALFDLLASLHLQLCRRSPFLVREGEATPPAPASVLAALDARATARFESVQRALDGERRLGDRAYLVCQLRTMRGLHAAILRWRQRDFSLRGGVGEEILRRWQDTLAQVRWNLNSLKGQELSANLPETFQTFSSLPGELQRLWEGLQKLVRGDPEAVRRIKEADEAFRRAFARVIADLEVQELFPGSEGG
ncbi:MAG: hypothetical protein HYZ53_26645 [Planctomycetes bacterium]|nr:hypothetical protein [Planctomycetota bacterium]